MQPTFLPWTGYFNLMAQADDFVFLDDVQLEKQSWQTRNRLLIGGQVQWKTVPVRHRTLAQTLAQSEIIDSTHWRDKLMRGFSQNYGRHLYFGDAIEIIGELQKQQATCLADLNEAVIRFIATRLGLIPRIYRSSVIDSPGIRSARLTSLCRILGATEYLSPLGSAEYLAEDNFVDRTSVALRFQDYTPMPYPQKGAENFISHLSIVDVVANLGWKSARKYVLNGVI